MINLSGKTIVITGAASGIGQVISKLLSQQGATLVLVDRDKVGLTVTISSLIGDAHLMFTSDITDFKKIESITNAVITSELKISGFVHCAGIERTIPFRSTTPSVFMDVFNINVFAGFEFARLLSQKSIVDPNGASFIFISSVKGILGASFNTAYCSSKSALIAGSKAIALELAPKKIRCNCVLPGFVETEMIKSVLNSIPPETKEKIVNDHPLGLGKPEDIAALVAFLLSDEARWITGAEYVIDGGFSAH